MLKSGEVLELLQSIPQGYLGPDEELFMASKAHLLLSYKKLGAISNYELEDGKKQSTNPSLSSSNKEIFCNVLGCDLIFDSISSYQSHYNAIHRYKCSECRKSMPTEHLLDLHILEHHDSFFKARVGRGERLYNCYLEECIELFCNPQERKEHCVNEHKFPSNFRFDEVVHRNMKKRGSPLKSGVVVKDKKEYNFFSFGHQREKVFNIGTGSKNTSEYGKALEEVNKLKEALDTI